MSFDSRYSQKMALKTSSTETKIRTTLIYSSFDFGKETVVATNCHASFRKSPNICVILKHNRVYAVSFVSGHLNSCLETRLRYFSAIIPVHQTFTTYIFLLPQTIFL